MKRAACVLILGLMTGPAFTEDRPTLAELFERVDPAVVEIATIQETTPDTGSTKRTRAGGLGSGFLISSDGTIMTAAHVVQMAEDVAVRWASGEISKAVIVSSNPNADVAIVRAATIPESVQPLALLRGGSIECSLLDVVTIELPKKSPGLRQQTWIGERRYARRAGQLLANSFCLSLHRFGGRNQPLRHFASSSLQEF